MSLRFAILTVAIVLSGCVTGYTLVSPKAASVAQGSMTVKPSVAWNKAPRSPLDVPAQEIWTQNGPLLDSITFIGALPSGQPMSKQKPKDDRKVPVFRPDMSPQDLVSMIESYYRIKIGATIFESTGVKPVTFLGRPGIQFDFHYVTADEVRRKGRAVFAVIANRFYLMSLDGSALHYFDASLPEFEAMAASAAIS